MSDQVCPMPEVDAAPEEELDLSQYEPEFVVEDDGLTIAAYEVDDQYVLDFDWADDSKWAPLGDPELFEKFTNELLGRLCNEDEVSPACVLDKIAQREVPCDD